MFQTLNFSDFGILDIVVRYLGKGDPTLNMKFIYVSYTHYAHSLKVILHNIFRVHISMATCHMKSDVNFFTYGIRFVLKKFHILVHFWILNFWIRDVQPIFHSNEKHI